MPPADADLQTLTRELPVADIERIEGTVDWFASERGFGFIRPDDDGAPVFVRHSGIRREGFKQLEAGQRVRFLRTSDARGPRATDVEPIE